MFGTIRRHQTWLWVVIATITIISFVVYFNPAAKSGAGMRLPEGDYGTMDGQRITREQFEAARREVEVLLALNQQRTDVDSAQVKFRAYQNLLLAHKQEELGIHITSEAAAAFGKLHVLGNATWDDVVNTKLKPNGLTDADLDRFLRHQTGTEQLMALIGTGGKLVTPGEAGTLYRVQYQEVATEMVYFAASNYLAAVTNSPEAVTNYYLKAVAMYRVPDKVQVNYVKYDVTNYLAAAKATMTNLDQLVEDNYLKIDTNQFPDAKTPAEIKVRFKGLLLTNQALIEARRVAGGFAEELDKAGPKADMEKLAAAKGLTVRVSAPFDENGPEDMKVPAAFGRYAMELSAEAPFSPAIGAEDGVYVLGFKQKIASFNPPFKDIETKVTRDYRETNAYALAEEAAKKFAAKLTDELNVNNGVTLPKDFATIAADNGLKPETIPPFSLSTTNVSKDLEDRVGLPLLKRAGFGIAVGQASPPFPVTGGLLILYIDKLLPLDDAKMKTELPGFLELIRRDRQNEAFNLWINAQITRDSGLMTKLLALQTEMQGGPRAPQPRP